MGFAGHRLGRKPIQTPQKCRQRFARSRGRQDQRVLASSDRVPTLSLGSRRGGEAAFEPGASCGTEALQRGCHVRLAYHRTGVLQIFPEETLEAQGVRPPLACRWWLFRPELRLTVWARDA